MPVQKQSGFTLIEIIVVVVIIGVFAVVMTLSFGDASARQSEQYLQRILALVNLATEQAVFNSRDYGLSFRKDGYHFYELEDGRWKYLTSDRMFKERELPAGLTHSLYLEGIKVVLEEETKARPQIFITSDGEISFFRLDVSDNRQHIYRLARNDEGLFTIAQVGS